MRKITLMTLILGLLVVGCDSDNGDDDSNTLVGTWAIFSISDISGSEITAFREGYESIKITFDEDSQATLDVDAIDDAADITFEGTYATSDHASATSKSLAITVTTGLGPQILSFSYEEFKTASRIEMTSSPSTTTLLASLLQISLEGPLLITLIKS